MSDKLTISSVKKHIKIQKIPGNTDIFVIACNTEDDRVFIPMEGTIALSTCVVDNSMASFLVNGFAFRQIKSFDFIIGVLSNSSDEIKPLSIPETCIKESFTDYEQEQVNDFMNSSNAKKFYFFQTAFFYEK
jgi:hypothetical protein